MGSGCSMLTPAQNGWWRTRWPLEPTMPTCRRRSRLAESGRAKAVVASLLLTPIATLQPCVLRSAVRSAGPIWSMAAQNSSTRWRARSTPAFRRMAPLSPTWLATNCDSSTPMVTDASFPRRATPSRGVPPSSSPAKRWAALGVSGGRLIRSGFSSSGSMSLRSTPGGSLRR